ncbi:MAG: hypothetical protein IK048_05630 [Clostridia bacterium]|nr:hypothetical protein [Clostridia bacterium]
MRKTDPEKKERTEIKRREGFFELMTRLNQQKDMLPPGEKLKLEKKDWFALLFSAFYTLFLPAAVVLAILAISVLLIFGYFS